ncbi:MAG: 3-hydroxyacyl-CoA dehydrogenase NAD-binding domain-containing protein [Gemmatimonadota bacterium]
MSEKTADNDLTLEIDGDRVGWLTFDQPGSSVNILSSDVMARLDRTLSALESRIANGQLSALVVRSGKSGFIAGADVKEIAALRDAAQATAASREGQRIFRRVERLRVPTIAAVDGTCLGGGTELILACAYRIASDRRETRIGLPEVRLGILPGFGGTVRLPRLCGIQNAFGLILTGKPASASRCRRIGLVDRVASHARFEEEVREFVADILAGAWERRPRRAGRGARLMEGTAPGRRILFSIARKRTAARTGGHYPAPLRVIDVVEQSWGRPLDEAFALEARALGELAAGGPSRGLVRVFLLSQGAKKALPEDELEKGRPVRKAAVLGAGVMGGAIAEVVAARDVPVVLKDIDRGALDAGLRHASDLLRKAARSRVFTEEEAGLKFALIEGTLDYDDFGDVDLAIEAVVEKMPVKQQVIRDLEEHVPAEAVIASNTSSLSVTTMASVAGHPERVIGLHFFNPVHKMPLVEVVRTEAAAPEAVATGFRFVSSLGKTPVLVADRPGFLVNRLLAPYLNEAGFLLEEGAGIRDVDEALVRFGMPMGPLRLLDEIGFDIASHASREMSASFGERMRPSGIMERLQEEGRLGRKNGRGFYLYADGKRESVDPALQASLGGGDGGGPPADEMRRRCLHLMVNEAAYALEEGVVAGADDIDLAMVMGTGFPPFRGGLLRWADGVGIDAIVASLEDLAARRGARFTPAPLLVSMAAGETTFTPHAQG